MQGFYDAVRDAFVGHSLLRRGSFARWGHIRAEALEGGWIARTSDWLAWVDPDGLTTHGLRASEDTNLGWYYNERRTEGAPLILHPVALVETTLEFFRFVYSHIRPRAGRGQWRGRVACRRFRSQNVGLPAGHPDREHVFVIGEGPRLASADQWNRDFDATGNAGRDAFEALQRFYALFGHPAAAIALVENDMVSESQLLALRG